VTGCSLLWAKFQKLPVGWLLFHAVLGVYTHFGAIKMNTDGMLTLFLGL